VSGSFQTARHAAFDLSFEGSIDGRQAKPRMPWTQALVELLSRDRLATVRERLGDEQALAGEPASPGGYALGETLRLTGCH
jgi:hypothetical protein